MIILKILLYLFIALFILGGLGGIIGLFLMYILPDDDNS